METALLALLRADVALAALVAKADNTGLFWNHQPQATDYPCLVLWRGAGAPGYTMAGPDRLVSSVVQADVWATSVDSLWAIRDLVITRLSGYRDLTFRGIFLRAERQTSEKPNDLLLHRCSMDFDVWHRAT